MDISLALTFEEGRPGWWLSAEHIGDDGQADMLGSPMRYARPRSQVGPIVCTALDLLLERGPNAGAAFLQRIHCSSAEAWAPRLFR